MKISDAILMGSLVLRPRGGWIMDPDGTSGCAFGMAYKAIGLQPDYIEISGTNLRYERSWSIPLEWKWVSKTFAPYPCNCAHFQPSKVENIIVHLFDSHIAEGGTAIPRWTLEQLIEEIKKYEDGEIAAGRYVGQDKEPEVAVGKETRFCEPSEALYTGKV